jgi:23S rRNA (guanosine2251-2'-O)-methyltransferase
MAKSSREHVYGLNPAFEVLRAGKRRVYLAHLNEGMRENARIKKLLGVLERGKIEIEWTDKGRLMQISGSRDHQGVVLKTSLYPYAEFDEMLDVPRMLMLDNVEDPHNVGAILRSAEVFGFSSVCLPKKGVPEIYPSVVKVSAGATEFMKICRSDSANGYARKAAEAGYRVAALDMAGKASLEALAEAKPEKLLLVIGGEDRSVGQFILNMADDVVGITQRGRINSLNASVAAGIAMFALGQAE